MKIVQKIALCAKLSLVMFSLTSFMGIVGMNKPKKLLKTLTYPCQPIKIFGGENVGEYTEKVDLSAECPYSKASLEELIKEAQENKELFILAVTTTIQSSPDFPAILQRSYCDAKPLHAWMYDENVLARKDDLRESDNEDEEPTEYSQHITFKEPILRPVYYFAIDSLGGEFRYIGNENIFDKDKKSVEFQLLLLHFKAAGIPELKKKEPNKTLYRLAELYVKQKDQKSTELANHYYKLAITYHNCLASMKALGNYCRNNKKFSLAEFYYKKAFNEHNDAQSLLFLAYTYECQEKYDLAEKYYLLMIEKHQNYTAMNNLGLIYKNQTKLDLAEKYFLDSLEKNGNGQAANFNLASLFEEKNNLELAEQYYTNAANLGNERAKIWLQNHSKNKRKLEGDNQEGNQNPEKKQKTEDPNSGN